MQPSLTPSLEDYLETIYLLQKGGDEARVRDIARERQVKASSVSPALKRLSELGYIEYEQRELIALTPQGVIAARRIYARHTVLLHFFRDILGMDNEVAKEEACGLEHALSDEGMDRFVQFFETISMCPYDANACHVSRQFINPMPTILSGCHQKSLLQSDKPKRCKQCFHRPENRTTLDKIEDGKTVKILRVQSKGKLRLTLLETGILPNIIIVKQRTTPNGVTILIDKIPIVLTLAQVAAIVVTENIN